MPETRGTPEAPEAVVSVIVPAYQAAATIRRQLEALDQQVDAPPFEVVVGDNGCTDTTAAVLAAFAPRSYPLRVVRADRRRGPAAARNDAVAAARGDLLVFCDADDVVSPRYVAAMAEGLARWDLVSGVQTTAAFADDDDPADARLREAEAELRGRPAALMRVTGFYDQVMTGSLGARRRVHEDVGGFREDLVGGGEDLHYGSLAQIRGFRLGLAPQAVVHVRPARGVRRNFRQQRLWSARGLQVLWELRAHGRREFSLAASARGTLASLAAAPRALRGDAAARQEWARELGTHVGELQANLRCRGPHILVGAAARARRRLARGARQGR